MSNLVFRLPRYYQDSPQVSELERVLGEQAGATARVRVGHIGPALGGHRHLGAGPVGAVGGAALRPHSALQLPEEPHQGQAPGPGRHHGGDAAQRGGLLRLSTPSQISVIEHPAEYQFEIVLSDLASVPSDVGGIEAAVNEIKPAHLDYWFTYELAQLLAALRVGGGLWSIQAVTLPPMEEE